MLYNLALDLLQLIMNVSSTAQGCMELASLTQNWKIYVFSIYSGQRNMPPLCNAVIHWSSGVPPRYMALDTLCLMNHAVISCLH